MLNMKKAKKTEFSITGDTLIIDITERFPELADFLVQEYGFMCIGCPLAFEETLAQGAFVHGLDEKQIDLMIKKMNEMIS